jgi:hypothetical protein
MSSVGVRRIGARIVAASMLLTALGGCLLTGVDAGTALADGQDSGSVQPPSPEGGSSHSGTTYVSSIGGGTPSVGGTPWTPPPCWMQPYFPQTETWKASDPSGKITDADSYYSWFVGQGAAGASTAAQDFESIQNRTAPAGWTGPQPIEADDVWWAANWLNSTTGYACAQGLAAKNNLSNGYIGLQPPLTAGQQSKLTGAINVLVLAQIARAAITLPKISIITSPAGTTTKSAAVVNTPTYVAVTYNGDMNPSKTKTDDGNFGLAPIWASVTTGFGAPGQTCAAVNGEATPACSVTFSAPSGNAPDNLQVSVTWKVTWSTSAGTGGTFPNTGGQQASRSVVVNEIQSQT